MDTRKTIAALLIAVILATGMLGVKSAFADTENHYAGSATGTWLSNNKAEGASDFDCAETDHSNRTMTATDFGFNIPSGATITGIQVTIDFGKTSGGSMTASLVKDGVADTANGKTFVRASPFNANCFFSANVNVPSVTNDTWGNTWTPADINENDFGVQLNSGNGNSDRKVDSIKITVFYNPFVDTVPPVVTAPDDILAEATGSLSSINLGEASAVDDVDGNVTVTNDAPAQFPLGITLVTYFAQDSTGNNATDVQTVEIVDTTAPELSIPDDLLVEAEGPLTNITLGEASAVDIVDGATNVTNDAPTSFPLGETIITYSSTDNSGNTASDEQTVTVVDTTAPTLIVPDDVTAEATDELTAVELGNASAFDLVDGSVVVSNDAPEGFPVGTTIITYSAIDNAGNEATGFQTVTITDETSPVIELSDSEITVEATGPFTSVNLGTASAFDLVDGEVNVTSDAPETFPLGITIVTYIAEDSEGNEAQAQQAVTVEDTTAPTLTIPPNVSTLNTFFDLSDLGTASATDLVDGPVVVTNNAPETFPIGTTIITYSATDEAGNTATGQQVVTIHLDNRPIAGGSSNKEFEKVKEAQALCEQNETPQACQLYLTRLGAYSVGHHSYVPEQSDILHAKNIVNGTPETPTSPPDTSYAPDWVKTLTDLVNWLLGLRRD